ncbi:MAG: restriction endonuclease subunit S [Micavibrio sp.]
MKDKWEEKTIGEVCEVVNGGTPKTGIAEYWGGRHQWITPAEMGKRSSPYVDRTERTLTGSGLQNSSARPLPPYSVILSSRAPIGYLVINTEPMATNQGCKGLVPKECLDHKFLFYYLTSIVRYLNDLGTGATFKELSGGKLKNVPLAFPPLSEQKHIVTMLDTAFEGIAIAVANAQRNLKNSRDLFETSVDSIFSQKGKGWSEKKLGDIAYLAGRIGWKGLTAKEYTKKGPLFLSVHSLNYGDYVDFRDSFHISQERYDESPEIILQPDDVLICKDGAGIGKMGIIKELPGPATINSSMLLIRALDGIKPKYLYRALCSQSFQRIIKEKIDGATTPHLYQRDIRQFLVPMPPLAEQNKIIKRLDAIHAETLRLEAIYKQKLKELAELKQSLLEKAFSGELTANNVVAFERPATSQTVETTSPEFAAHVLAFGHYWHEAQRRNNTYGHVKGQKFLHLAESEGKANMGRQPIKDAAGPNDFQHMLRAEEWAKSQQFFEFVPRPMGNGYDFKKLANYDTMIDYSLAAIKPYKDKLEKILALMMPMNSQEAEVLATVHAAWNNLLLDSVAITDDSIVREARNNWHPSKMNIPEAKFRKAITTIRNNGIVPDGTANRVTGQENFF